MSESGPKPEVAALRRDVCFAPVSGHRQAVSACLASTYNTERYRPIYANKRGLPIFLNRAS
jgi:hypothetical protein